VWLHDILSYIEDQTESKIDVGSPGFNPEDLQVDDWLKGL
jgi:hypothetical protein